MISLMLNKFDTEGSLLMLLKFAINARDTLSIRIFVCSHVRILVLNNYEKIYCDIPSICSEIDLDLLTRWLPPKKQVIMKR